MTPAVAVKGVVRRFATGEGHIEVLRGVDLTLDQGQDVAIVGPSGSGKSTLMHVMGALDVPDAGTVEVCGRDIGPMSEDERADFRRDQLGFVFQFFHLIPMLTSWENVGLPMLLGGTPLRKVRGRCLELLDRVRLGHRADAPAWSLSGGEMQRVAVARALVAEPEIVFADEPTGNLDTESGQAVLDLLRETTVGAGRTLVLVTHDPAVAAGADRVVMIVDGRVVDDGAPDRSEDGPMRRRPWRVADDA